MLECRINKIPLNEWGLNLEKKGISIESPKTTTSSITVPGLNGALDTTVEDDTHAAFLQKRAITLSLYALGDLATVSALFEHIAKEIHGKQGSLQTSDSNGEYRGRWSISNWNTIRNWQDSFHCALLLELSLDADPYVYGKKHTFRLHEGENHVAISGSSPVWPQFSLSIDTGSASISRQDGKTLTFSTGSHMNGVLTINANPQSRNCRINNNVILPTIDSDYFTLLPGANTITCTGCSGTLEATPLTLI